MDVKVCSVLGVLCAYWLLLSGITKEGWPPSRIHKLGILPVSAAPNNGLPSEAGYLSDFGSELNIDLGCVLQGWMSGHLATLQTGSQLLND